MVRIADLSSPPKQQLLVFKRNMATTTTTVVMMLPPNFHGFSTCGKESHWLQRKENAYEVDLSGMATTYIGFLCLYVVRCDESSPDYPSDSCCI